MTFGVTLQATQKTTKILLPLLLLISVGIGFYFGIELKELTTKTYFYETIAFASAALYFIAFEELLKNAHQVKDSLFSLPMLYVGILIPILWK